MRAIKESFSFDLENAAEENVFELTFVLTNPLPLVVRSSKLTSQAMLCLLLGVTGADNEGGGGTTGGGGGGGKEVSSNESSENRSSSLSSPLLVVSLLN